MGGSPKPLSGRKAVIVGGATGIGGAITATLARDGASVAALYNRGAAEAGDDVADRLILCHPQLGVAQPLLGIRPKCLAQLFWTKQAADVIGAVREHRRIVLL